MARWNLCISHAKRKIVNQMCFRANSFGKEVLELPQLADELVSQIYEGCPLIGAVTAHKIIHAAFYQVLSWDDKHVHVRDTETKQELAVAFANMKHMRLGFSMTYASAQSRTLRETVRLWDSQNRHFSSRHLSLGLSRAVSKRLVDIA